MNRLCRKDKKEVLNLAQKTLHHKVHCLGLGIIQFGPNTSFVPVVHTVNVPDITLFVKVIQFDAN